jgi:hypothetical protein
MIVMPSNNTGFMAGYLAGKYPGKLGMLMSPDGWRIPLDVVPYALDNGAYSAWTNNLPWDEAAFYKMLEVAKTHREPLWVACPDKVADRETTIKLWPQHSTRIRDFGYRPAFVVQDGMTPSDIPVDADFVFVGGSTKWKWRNLPLFAKCGVGVHVGRVNTYEALWICHELGAASCDGTGWMRGGPSRLQPLIRYLVEDKKGGREPCLLEI